MTRRSGPHLSLVAAARNDNHGGDLLRRMQIFVNGILEQCRRHDVSAELIVVEWNPPEDKPPLAEALRWPGEPGRCEVRIITVAPRIHARYPLGDRIPLFQMIAKNAGIRRARGEFILATNIDLLFSDQVMEAMKPEHLRPGFLYLSERWDVDRDVPLEASLDEQLAYCRDHVVRVNRRDGWYFPRENRRRAFFPYPWDRLYTFLRRMQTATAIHHPHRARSFRELWGWVLGPKEFHANACGDFTLMARRHWAELHAYPEAEIYSMNLDSVLCHNALIAGLKELAYGSTARIYHIEHASGFTPEGESLLNARLASSGIPQLTWSDAEALFCRARGTKTYTLLAPDTWGLAADDLPEWSPWGSRADQKAISRL